MKVKVVNRSTAGNLNLHPHNPFGDGSWVFISISDKWDENTIRFDVDTLAVDMREDFNNSSLTSCGCIDSCFMAFDDALPGDNGAWDLFTLEQAKQLILFIDTHIDQKFLIHCNAGISRSAAVGLFISKLTDTTEEFWNNHRNVFPNGHVSNLLRQAWLEHTGELVF